MPRSTRKSRPDSAQRCGLPCKARLHDREAGLHSRLALVILLDQFTRNVFRGSTQAFGGNARAALKPQLQGNLDFARQTTRSEG
ncbi:MAG: DUF924 family protein [Xanthomonadaceae bacterium]|nr:DUF924 family protein [Xanthomonadaceae bacterium]